MKEYKISSHNSTVCGYPGRDFDWSLFCWDGSEEYKDECHHFNCKHNHIDKAPLPWVDGKTHTTEYMHVPYHWSDQCAIYRVRPNDCMYAGEVYRGHLIKSVKAIKKEDGWYWRLEWK